MRKVDNDVIPHDGRKMPIEAVQLAEWTLSRDLMARSYIYIYICKVKSCPIETIINSSYIRREGHPRDVVPGNHAFESIRPFGTYRHHVVSSYSSHGDSCMHYIYIYIYIIGSYYKRYVHLIVPMCDTFMGKCDRTSIFTWFLKERGVDTCGCFSLRDFVFMKCFNHTRHEYISYLT